MNSSAGDTLDRAVVCIGDPRTDVERRPLHSMSVVACEIQRMQSAMELRGFVEILFFRYILSRNSCSLMAAN